MKKIPKPQIDYMPADKKKDLEPLVIAFFEAYALRGAIPILVEPSRVEVPGKQTLEISPYAAGSRIEEVCMQGNEAIGRLVSSGRSHATIDIGKVRYFVHYNYRGAVRQPF